MSLLEIAAGCLGMRWFDTLTKVRTLDRREAALAYASLGWPILPCHVLDDAGNCTCYAPCECGAPTCCNPGKHPRDDLRPAQASTDPRRIRGWWDRWPDANLATPTGTRFGLFVLDVDNPDGFSMLAKLETGVGRLPSSLPRARSGRGGLHVYFPYAPKGLGRRSRNLAPGLTWQGDRAERGRWILLPPSRTEGIYEWIAE